jgi:hypothetical protein
LSHELALHNVRGQTTTVFSPTEEFEDPTSPEGLPSEEFTVDLQEAWEELDERVQGRDKAIEPDERFKADDLELAFQIAFAFPDEVDIEVKSFGEGKDLSEHVRNHFDRLLNGQKDFGTLGAKTTADIERLLKLCELIFIDDAMFRFAEVKKFTTERDALRDLAFISQPPDVHDSFIEKWHQDLEIVWNILVNDLEEGIRVDKRIDNLYEKRLEFINHCRGNNIYMPITTDITKNPADLERNIKRKMRRGSKINSANIHKYCYLKERNIV